MPISLLPEGTVRRLGSTLVITTPVLLLKELLDNAIDSGATSVEVLVSSNAVDKIEVRDNGHGINPDDFNSLGRPGHTSKLRSFDELSELGGRTLGFRGAALASANVLADVSLTTRVPTEQVATVLSLAKEGGVGTQRHACAPVGTTVCVTDLFSRLPVRSQVAVKEAPKSLGKMKELLQFYALTRPWIRLRFTVPKTPSLSWSYAPAPNSGMKKAAMQIFGIELTSQCVFEIFPSESHRTEPSNFCAEPDSSHEQETCLVFEALLPSPEADPQKIGKGAFFSVDSRPVSATRGTAKKLYAIFKRRLGDHFAQPRSGDAPKNPFLRLNIRCPPGSYDVNVEPSKEDVLFKEEQLVLNQFESFLSSIYSISHSRGPPLLASVDVPSTNGEVLTSAVDSEVSIQCLPSQAPLPPWRVDMSSGLDNLSDDGNDTGEPSQVGRPPRTGENISDAPEDKAVEEDIGQNSKEGLNPWSIAKLTSTHRQGESIVEPAQEILREAQLPLLRHSASTSSGRVPLPAGRPERLSIEELDPQPRHRSRARNPASSGGPLHDVLERGFQRPNNFSSQLPNRQDQPRRHRGLQSPPTSSPRGYDHEGLVPRERPRSQYPASSGQAVQSQISFDRKHRRQRYHDDADLELGQQSSKLSNTNRHARPSAAMRRIDTDEAERIMAGPDINTWRERTQLEASPSPMPTLTHPLDAVEAATAVPRTDGRTEDAFQELLPVEDPRAQLIKHQRSATQNPQKKPRRLKTEQLPLETTPRNLQTRGLSLTMAADVGQLAQLFTGASQFDTYLVDGELRGAFEGGAGPEDNSVLVESLLTRIGRGPGATARGSQTGFNPFRMDD